MQLNVILQVGSSTAPALSSGKVLWATFAYINGGDNTMIEQWCDPYYMTGMTGDNGWFWCSWSRL